MLAHVLLLSRVTGQEVGGADAEVAGRLADLTVLLHRDAGPHLVHRLVLSRRGDERFDNVIMGDIRLSRRFTLPGGRSVTPQVDFFNVSNADTAVAHNVQVGSSYLYPSEILAPRIIRVGFSLNF